MSGRVSGGRMSAAHLEFKVVVLGESQVGKTCLVLRYIEGFFSPVQQSTVGAFFLAKKVALADGAVLKMQLWDTAGQERFHAMAPMYYRGAAAAIVAYDPSSEGSFGKCRDWLDELQRSTGSYSGTSGSASGDRGAAAQVVLAVVATKADLPAAKRSVDRARGEALAAECGAQFFEVSAMQDSGVRELFTEVSQQMWDRRTAATGALMGMGQQAASRGIVMGTGARGGSAGEGGGGAGNGGGSCC